MARQIYLHRLPISNITRKSCAPSPDCQQDDAYAQRDDKRGCVPAGRTASSEQTSNRSQYPGHQTKPIPFRQEPISIGRYPINLRVGHNLNGNYASKPSDSKKPRIENDPRSETDVR